MYKDAFLSAFHFVNSIRRVRCEPNDDFSTQIKYSQRFTIHSQLTQIHTRTACVTHMQTLLNEFSYESRYILFVLFRKTSTIHSLASICCKHFLFFSFYLLQPWLCRKRQINIIITKTNEEKNETQKSEYCFHQCNSNYRFEIILLKLLARILFANTE